MIWVIAGTGKGRELVYRLSDEGHSVVVTTATEYGSSMYNNRGSLVVRHGALDIRGMELLTDEFGIRLIIDASHPYSSEVKRNAGYVSEKKGIPLLELGRRSVPIQGAVEFSTYGEAAEYVSHKEGNILLAIGSKNIHYFRETVNQKIFARILPGDESVAECLKSGILHERIIPAGGAFSVESEAELMSGLGISILVTKDSGAEGGIVEKSSAAAFCGAEVVVIKRPERIGADVYFDIDEIIRRAGEILNG